MYVYHVYGVLHFAFPVTYVCTYIVDRPDRLAFFFLLFLLIPTSFSPSPRRAQAKFMEDYVRNLDRRVTSYNYRGRFGRKSHKNYA